MSTQTLIPMTPDVIASEKTRVLEYVHDGLTALTINPNTETAVNVWEAIQYLGQMAEALEAALGAAHQTTLETIAERDNAQRAFDEVTHAIKTINRDNPLVDDLVSIIEENVYEETDELIWDARREEREEVADEAYDEARDIIRQEIVDMLRHTLKLDFPQANRFVALLMDGDTAGIAPERLTALATAIEQLET